MVKATHRCGQGRAAGARNSILNPKIGRENLSLKAHLAQ